MALSFSSLLAGIRDEGDRVALDIPPDWMQGRSVFGGLQLVLALRAMRKLVGPEAILRVLQATFVAPVPGGTTYARAVILRSGKNATHVEARIVDGESTLLVAIGIFGAKRTSKVSVTPIQPAFEAAQRIALRDVTRGSPDFTRHFDPVWLRGLPPFTGDKTTDHVVEVGMIDEGPATEDHVVAIADFIPPLGLSHLDTAAPGSTITWMLEMLVDRVEGQPLTGWRVDAQLLAARDGYTSQSVMLWSPSGSPIAISRQHMLVFG